MNEPRSRGAFLFCAARAVVIDSQPATNVTPS
jgi:hypothetical protein